MGQRLPGLVEGTVELSQAAVFALGIEPCGWPGMMEKSLDCPLVKLNVHSGLVTLCAQLFAWTTAFLSFSLLCLSSVP